MRTPRILPGLRPWWQHRLRRILLGCTHMCCAAPDAAHAFWFSSEKTVREQVARQIVVLHVYLGRCLLSCTYIAVCWVAACQGVNHGHPSMPWVSMGGPWVTDLTCMHELAPKA